MERERERERERENERERESDRSQTADVHSYVSHLECLMVDMRFGRIHRLCPHNFHFFGDTSTYTDEFIFPLSICTCTADITHGSYSMKFF